LLFVLTLATALLTLASSGVIQHLLGAETWTIHVVIIVAVHAALRRPFFEGGVVVLITAFAADVLTSGPPGMLHLIATLVFFALFVVGQRVSGRDQRWTTRSASIALVMVFTASMVLDLALGVALALYRPTWHAMTTMADVMLEDGLATTLGAMPYMLILGWFERIWQLRADEGMSMRG